MALKELRRRRRNGAGSYAHRFRDGGRESRGGGYMIPVIGDNRGDGKGRVAGWGVAVLQRDVGLVLVPAVQL